jgi:hypothetical protein
LARRINRPNARKVATLTQPGRHTDGGDLSIGPNGGRSWTFLFRWHDQNSLPNARTFGSFALLPARERV